MFFFKLNFIVLSLCPTDVSLKKGDTYLQYPPFQGGHGAAEGD